MKSSLYYFHMKTKILAGFHICISVSLTKQDVQSKVVLLWLYKLKYLKSITVCNIIVLYWKQLKESGSSYQEFTEKQENIVQLFYQLWQIISLVSRKKLLVRKALLTLWYNEIHPNEYSSEKNGLIFVQSFCSNESHFHLTEKSNLVIHNIPKWSSTL